jgi:hypothetical protein
MRVRDVWIVVGLLAASTNTVFWELGVGITFIDVTVMYLCIMVT